MAEKDLRSCEWTAKAEESDFICFKHASVHSHKTNEFGKSSTLPLIFQRKIIQWGQALSKHLKSFWVASGKPRTYSGLLLRYMCRLIARMQKLILQNDQTGHRFLGYVISPELCRSISPWGTVNGGKASNGRSWQTRYCSKTHALHFGRALKLALCLWYKHYNVRWKANSRAGWPCIELR